jgi:hypothetical protein
MAAPVAMFAARWPLDEAHPERVATTRKIQTTMRIFMSFPHVLKSALLF